MKTDELKSIKIDKDVHKKLKIYCIQNELKISSVLENIILKYIENNNKLNATN